MIFFEDKFDFTQPQNATKREIKDFKNEIFNIDEIFVFINYRCGICKYLNIINSMSDWGEIMHSFKPDFCLPLYSYWHYYKKGEKIVYNDILKKSIGDPQIEKFKEMYVKQFYVAFTSLFDKLKLAYSFIYNIPFNNFKNFDFNLQDEIFLKSGLKEDLLNNLENIKIFNDSPEFTKFRQLRNSSVHNIGGKKAIWVFKAQNNNDFIRELLINKNHISDKELLSTLKILLPKYDKLCTEFNTLNLKYAIYLSQFEMPGKIVGIK